MRCLHLNSNGDNCPSEAIEGAEFCEAHLPLAPVDEHLESPWLYRFARRIGAAILLGLFLLQLYVGLKTLYGW